MMRSIINQTALKFASSSSTFKPSSLKFLQSIDSHWSYSSSCICHKKQHLSTTSTLKTKDSTHHSQHKQLTPPQSTDFTKTQKPKKKRRPAHRRTNNNPSIDTTTFKPPTYTNFDRTPYPKKLYGKGDHPFVDLKWIKVQSGSGGDGSINFFKSLQLPIGPPCGGNGGRGADVYIVASKEITSLGGLRNSYKGPNGKGGQSNNMHGQDGETLEILVPVGTTIRQVDSQEEIARRRKIELQKEVDREREMERVRHEELALEEGEEGTVGKERGNREFDEEYERDLDDEESTTETTDPDTIIHENFIFRKGYSPMEDRLRMLRERMRQPIPKSKPINIDLTKDGDRHLLLRGGRGGFGNPHFASNEIKGPGMAERGEKGQSIWLELELKSIADAGLVGLPNAGKSTLLAAISNAHPRIGSYPFTTLNPYVGTIDFPDFYTMTVADIPGLVQGAHLNVGLGHAFLRHVERSRALVYVVDLAGMDPARDLRVLKRELEAYQVGLSKRPSMVIANKADLGAFARENLESLMEEAGEGVPVVPVSAKERKNIVMATSVLRNMIEDSEKGL
ncbi:hypothetical protein HDU76_001690 [Blyttiomyces sp. JEL0837]|nr:hypothetical protein HDU76_001690 [Blyttiomyces sp. JEL0837]